MKVSSSEEAKASESGVDLRKEPRRAFSDIVILTVLFGWHNGGNILAVISSSSSNMPSTLFLSRSKASCHCALSE